MNKYYGLLGKSLSHSLSPQIHQLIFKYVNHPNVCGDYRLIQREEDEIPSTLLDLSSSGCSGINVTIPYKETVLPFLTHLSKEAGEIGAVNTIRFAKDGKTHGYNTDYYGFLKMLSHHQINPKGKSVAILGTGGASKAIYKALVDINSSYVALVTRTLKPDKCGDFPLISYEALENSSFRADILINTTPVGMYPNINNCPVSEKVISQSKAAVDIIYNPRQTLFLSYASKHNIACCNGLFMLIGQAIKAQEIWNQIEIPDSVLLEIAKTICAAANNPPLSQ